MDISARVLALMPALLVLASSPLQSAEWGTLTGRFVFDGEPPVPAKIDLNKDVDVCSKKPPIDEDLLVNAENRGVANIVVTLELKKGASLPAIHPEYAKTAQAKVRMTNKYCRFEPRITTLRTTQTLVIGNDDDVAHNSLAYLTYNTPFNVTIATGSNFEKQLDKSERRSAMIKCSIHGWMKSWLVIREHPYVAVTDKDGRFTIRNLPTGEWTFQFWQEKAGYVSHIDLGGQKVEDKKGLYQLPIDREKVDLGDIRLEPKLFEK